MRAPSIFCLIVLSCLFLGVDLGVAAKTIKVDPTALGQIEFPVPENPSDADYLGLKRSGSFKLPQVKADTLVIEVFSMYCPYCQEEAPNVNRIYQALEKDPKTRGKTKVLGIGTGNTLFEVNHFRKTYEIPFPLVPDVKYALEKALKHRFRTPTFIVVKIRPGSPLKVILTHPGRVENIEKFLQAISDR